MNRFSHSTLDLNGDWSFSLADKNEVFTSFSQLESSGLEVLPATVPGNLELDLQRNGVIEEPFFQPQYHRFASL
jgi:hypothetical protein